MIDITNMIEPESNPAALESERAMNANLTGEVERLQARVAEKCDAPVGWIDPYKYKAACESKMEFFKTIKELREQNEKLQARVAELESFINQAPVETGVCMCGDDIKDHNQASGHSPVDVWDHAVEQINKEGRRQQCLICMR